MKAIEKKKRLVFATVLLFLMVSCKGTNQLSRSQKSIDSGKQLVPTPDYEISLLPLPLVPVEPEECRIPTGSYSRIIVNGQDLNERTYQMLEYAASLYNGVIDIAGLDILQGSYTDKVPTSFQTHMGGGAVDIKVYRGPHGTGGIRYSEIDPLLRAMRLAGFAAWYRDYGDEGENSAEHIHAIAIGDIELSQPATSQLVSSCGYFTGYAGIPIQEKACRDKEQPIIDDYGGPIVCEWMCKIGYDVLRNDIRCKLQ